MARRPTPTAIKKRRGRLQPCRTNTAEPDLPTGAPACPEWIQGEAREEWGRLVGELLESRVLTRQDRRILAECCQLHAVQLRLLEEMATATGGDRARLVSQHRNGANALRLFLVELGLSPAARSKVKTSEEKPADPLEEWQKLKAAHTVAGGKSVKG